MTDETSELVETEESGDLLTLDQAKEQLEAQLQAANEAIANNLTWLQSEQDADKRREIVINTYEWFQFYNEIVENAAVLVGAASEVVQRAVEQAEYYASALEQLTTAMFTLDKKHPLVAEWRAFAKEQEINTAATAGYQAGKDAGYEAFKAQFFQFICANAQDLFRISPTAAHRLCQALVSGERVGNLTVIGECIEAELGHDES